MTAVPANNRKQNLVGLTAPALGSLLEGWGENAYRGKQILQWIHRQGVLDFSQMLNLSKSLRQKLEEHAELVLPEVISAQESSDGTIKWLFKVGEGNAIETVYIPDKTRATLCVSSQVGCALNCSFCATGKEGFNRNLTTHEIVGQLWLATRLLKLEHPDKHPITNIVFMGMGEPLLNQEAVVAAIEIMLDDLAYGLSKYRVTVSTSGLVPAMVQLKKQTPAALAVSLHAPNNRLRDELVPLNKKYPLEQLIPACKDYFRGEKKRVVTFEYVMLEGVNDSLACAKELITLLQDVPCKINLIPFNPFSGSNYKRSSDATVDLFQQRLMGAGFNTRVRRTRGPDIDAACGQLAGKIQDITGRHQRWLRTGQLVPTSKRVNG